MAERDDLLLGADMGGTRFRAALVDGRSEIVWRAEQPAGDVGDSEALVAAMTGLLGQGLARAGTSLRAAGVAVAGPLDPVRGVMFRPPNLPGLAGLPLASLLGKALDRPVFLENDANAAAWGEFACGAARDASSMVLLTLGTGVGGGIVLDGRLLRGARGCAAELGHMVVNPAGPLCNCGARGCLEMYASSTAVLAAWRAAVVSGRATEPEDGGVEDTEGLFRLAERGDAAARAVFAEAGGFLGEALGSLANALDIVLRERGRDGRQ